MEALGAAAQGISDLLSGAECAGTVLGCWSAAVILGFDTPGGYRIVSLLGPRASGVPNGIRLGSGASPAGLTAGDTVILGSREVRLGGLTIRVVREFASQVFPILVDRGRLDQLRLALRSTPLGVPGDRLTALLQSVERGDAAATAAAAYHLVGLGIGSTPGGDDVLAGLLIGWRATGEMAPAAALWSAISPDLTRRTTALSADLLALAARGHAAAEALDVLRALDARCHPAILAPALDRLVAVGHTSGADLAAGLVLGSGARGLVAAR